MEARREGPTLEYKERLTPSYLKTVSAFANYGTGKIVFGVSDDGEPAPLADPIAECLNIENAINDALDPTPIFRLEPDTVAGTVTLTVFAGERTPYLYKNKAYRRADSSTVEVDRLEFGRLVLAGNNQSFDELPICAPALEFSVLAARLRTKTGVTHVDENVLKTLGLLTLKGEYTNAAAILADKNSMPGVDLIKFGESIDIILDSESHAGVSLLEQYDASLKLFEKNYVYEEITGSERVQRERVPGKAFREALVNALVHRAWDVRANVRISMYSDRVEITSPGSLPPGMTVENYINGRISNPRNPVIAGVFHRLGLIERFGTGISRIKGEYEGGVVGPSFSALEGSVTVILPVKEISGLTEDERKILAAMSGGQTLTRSQIESKTGFSKDKVVRLVNALMDRGLAHKRGMGRATRYFLM